MALKCIRPFTRFALPQLNVGEGTEKTLIAHPPGGCGLDAYLAGELAPEYSRSQISKAIKAGLVVMNQRTARAADPIHAGDRIEFRPAARGRRHPRRRPHPI